MKHLIAYCGLDCQKCEAHIATINDERCIYEGGEIRNKDKDDNKVKS